MDKHGPNWNFQINKVWVANLWRRSVWNGVPQMKKVSIILLEIILKAPLTTSYFYMLFEWGRDPWLCQYCPDISNTLSSGLLNWVIVQSWCWPRLTVAGLLLPIRLADLQLRPGEVPPVQLLEQWCIYSGVLKVQVPPSFTWWSLSSLLPPQLTTAADPGEESEKMGGL